MRKRKQLEGIDGDVVASFGVEGDDKGIQLTAINLRGQSTTELFIEDGEYHLVRADDE